MRLVFERREHLAGTHKNHPTERQRNDKLDQREAPPRVRAAGRRAFEQSLSGKR